MKQKLITPEILNCFCGATANNIDWDYNEKWQVICENNHTLTKKCNKHRAVCLWNNRVKKLLTNNN